MRALVIIAIAAANFVIWTLAFQTPEAPPPSTPLLHLETIYPKGPSYE